MVIEARNGEDILDSGMKHICFAVNTEGKNDSGFAGYVSRHFWPELEHIGPCEMGTSMTLDHDGIFFHALVCHSIENGWRNPAMVVRKCFDDLDTNDPVASVVIGTSIDGLLSGASFTAIEEGMQDSAKNIILFKYN